MECWSRKVQFETLGSNLVCWDPYLQQLWNPVHGIPKKNFKMKEKISLIRIVLQTLCAKYFRALTDLLPKERKGKRSDIQTQVSGRGQPRQAVQTPVETQ